MLEERLLEEILDKPALAFVDELHRQFAPRLGALLHDRVARQQALTSGGTLTFLPETKAVRDDTWVVASPRLDYSDRRVEITGPTDRKMVINALNSGALGFMADFEDANSPTWANQVAGQANILDAVQGTINHTAQNGRRYSLSEATATLMVRPRGLHLPERHLRLEHGFAAGALVDFGLFVVHCARRLVERGQGVYLYLPKLEHHLEARWWNDVISWSEDSLGLERGDVRATILIETLPAAFQMDEILFELREHSNGLNAGRWDYIFSMIKSFREQPAFLLPDRDDIKMTVPFMKAYTDLLVQTCHARGAFAMGGMSALVPSRSDVEATARAAESVRTDKEREARAGFDGTWVAHPDVVPVAMRAFDAVLGGQPNQIGRRQDVARISDTQLLDVGSTPGQVTELGLRRNINIAFQYISHWLRGRGAVAINNMMEDAATAEISRAQIWQWIRHRATLSDGREVSAALVEEFVQQEMTNIRDLVGLEVWEASMPEETLEIFRRTALADDFPDFLTLPAYDVLTANV